MHVKINKQASWKPTCASPKEVIFLCQGRAQLNSVISPREVVPVKRRKASLIGFREIWSSNSSATETNEIFIRAVWGSETFIHWEIHILAEGGIGLRRNVVRKTRSAPQVRSAGSAAPGLCQQCSQPERCCSRVPRGWHWDRQLSAWHPPVTEGSAASKLGMPLLKTSRLYSTWFFWSQLSGGFRCEGADPYFASTLACLPSLGDGQVPPSLPEAVFAGHLR